MNHIVHLLKNSWRFIHIIYYIFFHSFLLRNGVCWSMPILLILNFTVFVRFYKFFPQVYVGKTSDSDTGKWKEYLSNNILFKRYHCTLREKVHTIFHKANNDFVYLYHSLIGGIYFSTQYFSVVDKYVRLWTLLAF